MGDNQNYVFNRGKLKKGKFALLPLSSVKAHGWLQNQLILLSNGLTAEMEKYPDYSASSAWLGGAGEDWERGPYYMRGLVAQAYQLNDKKMIDKAQKWIDCALESQNEEGFFGPKSNTDWWPRMPVLMALRDYYEATEAAGAPDERVLPFMEKYFRYQLKTLPHKPLYSWANARGGDNMDSVYWLYNRLYENNAPEKTDWLLELCELLRSQTQDWTGIFSDSTAREHVVNTSQAMKMPAVAFQGSHDPKDKNALKKGLENIKLDHGRIDELPNSDEAARDNKPTRGTELCGIAEGMLSTEIAARILGEGWLGDHLEALAYNALPAAYSPDYLGHVYYITQNQVLATRGKRGFDCDHGDDAAFGAPGGFDCCFANNHMAWPKFFQSMWMATRNGGLAVVAYGPNEVLAKVADSKTAVFIQKTDYPFGDDIELEYRGETAEFPLMLRIPEWCDAPEITLCGGKIGTDNIANGYITIDRAFTKGDKIQIKFPSKAKASAWYNNSVALKRGALIYSLKIEEEWVESSEDNSVREIKTPLYGKLKCREVFPKSRWNYGLCLDYDDLENSFELKRNEIPPQPFKFDAAPIELICTGQILPEWELDGNLAGELPFGCFEKNSAMQEKITLIPYGCGRLKITQFPRIGGKSTDNAVVINNFKSVDGKYRAENVVVPPAREYNAQIKQSCGGELKVTVNGCREIIVMPEENTGGINGLKSLIETPSMQFNADNFNTLSFDARVEQVVILPIDYQLEITARACFEAAQIEYNIIQDATHYILSCKKGAEIEITRRVTSNGFKGGEPFEADRFSVTLASGEYEVRLTAYKEKTEICRSNIVKVKI